MDLKAAIQFPLKQGQPPYIADQANVLQALKRPFIHAPVPAAILKATKPQEMWLRPLEKPAPFPLHSKTDRPLDSRRE